MDDGPEGNAHIQLIHSVTCNIDLYTKYSSLLL